MNVILHIGIEKTGTTALQSFLTDNRQYLNENGYAYLESPGLPSNRKLATYCIDTSRHDDHHKMLNIIDLEARSVWREQFLVDFYKEIDALESHVHTVIISNEQLHSRLILESEIEMVRDTLAARFDDVKVIVYLRRQDQLATSLYSTALKCGHSFDSILPGVANDNHYYNFEVLLDKWSKVFGEESITPRIFDRSRLIKGDLLSDFFHASLIDDLDLSEMKMPGRQNESLEPKAQEFLSLANKHIPMMVDGNFNQLRANLTEQLEDKYSGKPALPMKDDALAFCRKFIESNQRVAKKWFSEGALFSQNFDSYPESLDENQHSFEDAVVVAANILNGMHHKDNAVTDELLVDLQESPEDTTRILADYFISKNPALANYLRQNIALAPHVKQQKVKLKVIN